MILQVLCRLDVLFGRLVILGKHVIDCQGRPHQKHSSLGHFGQHVRQRQGGVVEGGVRFADLALLFTLPVAVGHHCMRVHVQQGFTVVVNGTKVVHFHRFDARRFGIVHQRHVHLEVDQLIGVLQHINRQFPLEVVSPLGNLSN